MRTMLPVDNDRDARAVLSVPEMRIAVVILMKRELMLEARLPDGDSQIFRSYMFGPSGFWTMAPLRYAAKFDPLLSLDCAPRPPPWRNPRKGRDQILPSGNPASKKFFY